MISFLSMLNDLMQEHVQVMKHGTISFIVGSNEAQKGLHFLMKMEHFDMFSIFRTHVVQKINHYIYGLLISQTKKSS